MGNLVESCFMFVIRFVTYIADMFYLTVDLLKGVDKSRWIPRD